MVRHTITQETNGIIVETEAHKGRISAKISIQGTQVLSINLARLEFLHLIGALQMGYSELINSNSNKGG